MAKTANLFADMDFTKIMGDFRVPQIDPGVFMSIQKKNLDALTAANQIAFDSLRATAKRQSEIVTLNVEAFSSATHSITGAKTFEDQAAAQATFLKDAFERSLSQARELAEIFTDTANKVTDVVKARIVDAISEASEIGVKKNGAAAAAPKK
ncbi:MAG: phasin family protein [Alphaproteobacteria bacterium]